MSFSDLALDHRVLKKLEQLGYTEPTDIQRHAIPYALTGKDLMAQSKTGSGKTLAFLLPALQRVMRQRALTKRDPRVLVLTPTRELAQQVYGQLRALLTNTTYQCALVVGGDNYNDQVKKLARDPEFVVGTPGRIANHLKERSLFLKGLELLVLDEADRMLDLGFADELRSVNAQADHRLRQTLMFSATLEHTHVKDLAKELLKAPHKIALDEVSRPHADIRQRFLFADHLDHKQALLSALLKQEDYQQAIIFTATRSDTERLAALISEQGYKTVALSGELNQTQRQKIMDEFSRGRQQIMVTTDIASRGLDLLNVSLVVNFDLPTNSEEYVHRIGRTGRAGAQGDAVSLVGPKDWNSLQAIEKYLSVKFEFFSIEGLEAKFKGLKPKPKNNKKPVGAKFKKSPFKKQANKKSEKEKREFKRSEIISSDGFAPLKKKK